MTTTRTRVAGLFAAAALLLAAACGGDDGDSDAEATDTTAADTTEAGGGLDGDGSDTTATTESEGPVEGDVELAGTAHYAGFVYTLTGASVAPDAAGVTTVTIDFDVENASPDASTPYPSEPTLELEDGTGVTGSYETTSVPAGGNGTGLLTFTLDSAQAGSFDLETTTLTFGDADTEKVRLALDGEDQQVLAPIDLGELDELTSGGVTFTVETATLRWDDPDRRTQAPEGDAYVELVGTVSNGSDSQHCSSSSYILTAPDGVDEPADVDYGCIGAGETVRDARMLIEVQAIETGTYTLSFDAFPDSDASDPQTVEIEVDLDAEPETSDDEGADAGDDEEADDPEDDDTTTTEG